MVCMMLKYLPRHGDADKTLPRTLIVQATALVHVKLLALL